MLVFDDIAFLIRYCCLFQQHCLQLTSVFSTNMLLHFNISWYQLSNNNTGVIHIWSSGRKNESLTEEFVVYKMMVYVFIKAVFKFPSCCYTTTIFLQQDSFFKLPTDLWPCMCIRTPVLSFNSTLPTTVLTTEPSKLARMWQALYHLPLSSGKCVKNQTSDERTKEPGSFLHWHRTCNLPVSNSCRGH